MLKKKTVFESIFVNIAKNKSKSGLCAESFSLFHSTAWNASILRTVFESILWNKGKMVKLGTQSGYTIQATVATTINHNKKNNHNFVWQRTWLAQNTKGDDAKEEVKKIQTIQTPARASHKI